MDYLKRIYESVVTKPQVFFAAFAGLFGILFLIAIPPLQTPDETTHFIRSYALADFNLVSDKSGGEIGYYVEGSIASTIDLVDSNGEEYIKFNPSQKFDMGKTREASSIQLQGDTLFYETASSASYISLVYAPQALGIIIGKIFDTPVIGLLYLARLANLAAWIAIGYFAIKIMPVKKWALVAILMLPMMIAQSVSLGTDVLSIGGGVLFVSLILRKIMTESGSRVDNVLLISSAVVMVVSKVVMAALLPLLLVLFFKNRKKRTVSTKTWGLVVTTVFAPLVFYFAWTAIMGMIVGAPDSTPVNGESPTDQLVFVLTEPWQLPQAIFNTFFFTWGDGVIQSLIGNFGWVDTPIAGAFVVIGYIAIAFALFVNEPGETDKKKLTRGIRLLFLTCALIYFVGVCAAMYIYFTPAQFQIIVGIQGRYFIPALVLLIPVLYGSYVLTSKRIYENVIKVTLIGLACVSIVSILFRYYIVYL